MWDLIVSVPDLAYHFTFQEVWTYRELTDRKTEAAIQT